MSIPSVAPQMLTFVAMTEGSNKLGPFIVVHVCSFPPKSGCGN